MKLKKQIKKDLSKLKEGESLVAIYETENNNGAFLIIGEDAVNYSWAVTDAELKELYGLLKRRFE